jgi:hypothetical protein
MPLIMFVSSSFNTYVNLLKKKISTNIDADMPNTKRNHANDSLEVPIGPITRVRAKKLKEALNELVQNIWRKMDLRGLGHLRSMKDNL